MLRLIEIHALIALMVLTVSCKRVGFEYDTFEKPIDTFLESQEIMDRPYLKIKNSAFSRDFFFYGSFIPVLSSTVGYSLRGRVIRFLKPYADRVIMVESPKGHSIANDKESMILLAEFPVVKADDDGVVIDFAKGMNSAFTMRNVHSQATIQKESGTAEQFKSISLSASFVKSIKEEENILSISQIAQWRNNKSELISAEIRYFLQEYLPSLNFEKNNFSPNRWVQFFSTPPLVESPTTNQFAYITKWNLNKPMVFYISSNTPKIYRQAIADGILFWNHIFGKNVIKVKDLEEGISAPHPPLNIIQWVVWDNEASAYADMVIDHLTGEIMQAQIYLHSGWVSQSSQRLRNQLTELLLTDQKKIPITSIEEAPMPSMLSYEEPCIISLADFAELSELTSEISISDITDETITILTGDILRAVIAHEMGHVLGLRHNLAASTQGNISLSERQNILRTYLHTGDYSLTPGTYFSTSIMDVFSAADDAIVGAQIREILNKEDLLESQIPKIYQYDKQAIDYGYFNQPMKGSLAFCTDEDSERYLDCGRWDISNTSVLFASSRLNNALDQIAVTLADTFIKAIDPKRKGGPIKIRDVSLNTSGVLNILNIYIKGLFSWAFKGARSINVESDFPAIGPHNQAEITEARFKKVREQVEIYGVEKTFFGLLPPFNDYQGQKESFLKSFKNHFETRLAELGPGDFALLSPDAFKIAENFFISLQSQVVDQLLTTLTKAQFDDPLSQEPIELALGKIAQEIILSTKDKSPLPTFSYELRTRDLAARLLNPALGILPDWSFESLNNISKGLKQIMRAGLNSPNIDLENMPRDKRQWMLEQNRILTTLMQVKTMSRPLYPEPKEVKVAK